MVLNIFWSAQLQHHHLQAKGVDSMRETAAWQPLTSHTSSERQRVMQRTWRWREKSILSFRSATGLRAATARWARGLSKIHTCLAGSNASGPCVFQRKRWGKRFLLKHPCTWQGVLACLCVFAPSQPQLNIPLHQYLSSLVAKMACGLLVSQRWRSLPSLVLIWLSCVRTIFCHYLPTLQIPLALLSNTGPRG